MRSSGSGFFADLSADAAAITRLSSFDFPAPCAAKLKLVREPALPVHNVLMPTELMIHVEDAAVSVRPASEPRSGSSQILFSFIYIQKAAYHTAFCRLLRPVEGAAMAGLARFERAR